MKTILVILNLFCFISVNSQIVLNEVMYANRDGLKDHWGKRSDWVEIYNFGNENFQLQGFGLTDNPNKPHKWQFPETIIMPGEYKIIFLADRDFNGDTLHAGFKLQQVTESLILSSPSGVVIDSFAAQCVPYNKSAIRVNDGIGYWAITSTPSPGQSNIYSELYNVKFKPDTVIASRPSGYYQNDFPLELTNWHDHNEIFYTLNGKEPDERSIQYDSIITVVDRSNEPNNFSEIETSDNYIKPEYTVFKSTVIRAIAYSDGCPASEINNLTFFVHPEMYKKYHVPVISIIAEPDDLFSDEEGIYVRGNNNNYLGKGKEWERKVHVQMFDTTGVTFIDQNAGARIHGRGTRLSAQKSLRLYADVEYGKASFDYPFFKDRNLDSYKCLLLRTTRGDWINTLFTDNLSHDLIKDMNVDYMSGLTAVVFINGEYWGIHTLRERQDEDYISSHHFAADSLFDVINFDGGGPFAESGDMVNYEELINLISDESLDETDFYRQISEKIDLAGMMDYFIAEMYLGNIDFPFNNHTMWRPAQENGRWRWFFYDCDACFYRYNYDHLFDYINESDIFERYPEWSMLIMRRLIKNDEFRALFTQRFFQTINEYFQPEKVISKIDSFSSEFQPLMAEHIQRWHEPGDVTTWLNNVERLRQFALGRPVQVTDQLIKYFGYPILIYPNPAKNFIMLKSDLFESGENHVSIYNLMGQKVLEYTFSSMQDEFELNIGSLIPGGTYIITIATGYFYQSQVIHVSHD